MKKSERLTPGQAKVKLAKYCAYQERSQQQVRDKLYSYGLYEDEVEELIVDLIGENFINEERFAKSYVGGKFRIKKWGRLKIMQGLNLHKISKYCIKKGMEEIDNQEYLTTLDQLLAKKRNQLGDQENEYILKYKMARYAIGRGFEAELVWEALQ